MRTYSDEDCARLEAAGWDRDWIEARRQSNDLLMSEGPDVDPTGRYAQHVRELRAAWETVRDRRAGR